jgi:hypothetical protein
MARGGSRPGERRGGRAKGTPNKRTTERKLFAEARSNGRPLAKEVLEESMLHYLELASQCARPEQGHWQREKQKQFFAYRDKADERARWLAPYQSPTYRSITVQPPRQRAAKGTPAIDALEAFVLQLARQRRVHRLSEPKTIEAVAVPDETPAEPVPVIDGKNSNGR